METANKQDQKPGVISRATHRVAEAVLWHGVLKHQIDKAVRRQVEAEDRQGVPGHPVRTMDVDTGQIHAYDRQGVEVHPYTGERTWEHHPNDSLNQQGGQPVSPHEAAAFVPPVKNLE